MAFGFLPKSSSFGVYLNQWLKTASKDNIVFCYSVGGLTQNLLRFKCQKCGDNWNVGESLFQGGIADPVGFGIPSELQDWVKNHRHVCKKFVSYINYSEGVQGGECANCKWPYGAHEESWQQKAINPFNQQGLAQGQQNVLGSLIGQAGLQGAYKPGKVFPADDFSDMQKKLAAYELWKKKYEYEKSVQKEPEPKEVKPKIVPPLPEHKGRKFRD